VRNIDGLLFFWLSWLSWIIATFLIKKTSKRFQIAIIILLAIIFSHSYLAIHTISLNLSMLLLLIIGCVILASSKKKQKIYILIISSIIMMAYVSILMLHLYDPIWFIFNIKYMIAIVCACITLFLCRDLKFAVAALLIGVNFGELIYSLVIYNIHQIIYLQPHFALDIIAISFSTAFLFHTYSNLLNFMEKSTMKSAKRGRAQI
jgi:hypothetical protein